MSDDAVRSLVNAREFGARVAQRWAANPRADGEPPVEAVIELFETAFWASLLTLEGRMTRIRMRIYPSFSRHFSWPGDVSFCTPLEIDSPKTVAEIAPCVGERGVLAVEHQAGKWRCHGIVTSASPAELDTSSWASRELAIVAPGFLVATGGLGGSSYLIHDRGECIDQDCVSQTNSIVEWANRVEGHCKGSSSANVRAVRRNVVRAELGNVLAAIVRRAHGGLVLIAPDFDEQVRSHLESYVEIEEKFPLQALLSQSGFESFVCGSERKHSDPLRKLFGSWSSRVADLAAVDGAVVLDDRGFIRAYRAIVAARKTLENPADEDRSIGTRRRSAERFAQGAEGRIGVAVSQDGTVRVFSGGAAGAKPATFRYVDYSDPL